MRSLGIRPDTVISEDGDSFATVLCRDEADRPVVLKYVHSRSKDAYRRLKNETLLIKYLGARSPLQLLSLRSAGDGYLLTERDPGRLLRSEDMDSEDVIRSVAAALVEFQSSRLDPRHVGIVDRERLSTFYVKELIKQVLHLWPIHLTAGEAARCTRIVCASLPAILGRSVICHGDFRPTNLLYDAETSSVTFTDLEGFITGNHPLFDVLSLLTISTLDLDAWSWQPRFLRVYLDRAALVPGLALSLAEFERAYRGILVFFLLHRLNEWRVALSTGAYFDGQRPLRYLGRKLIGLASGGHEESRHAAMAPVLVTRKRNLLLALSPDTYSRHLATMRSALSS